MIRKGSFIEVEQSCEFKDEDLKIFIRGNCLYDCEIGEEAYIKTINGNIIKGMVLNNKFISNNLSPSENSIKEILFIGK